MPAQRAQNRTVSPLPSATMTTTQGIVAAASMAIHLLMRAPNRWQHHGQDADDRYPCNGGHSVVKPTHILDVAAADGVLDGADTEKEQAFRDSMENYQQHCRYDGRRCVDAGAGDYEAQVGNGGIGKDFFAVTHVNGQG